MKAGDFELACPICRGALDFSAAGEARCPKDGQQFQRIDNIWHFLPPERVQHYEQFIRDYETIRKAEGRFSDEPAYYRALPYQDLAGRQTSAWKVRSQSFDTLVGKVLAPLETEKGSGLKILDVGAGSGWLSNRLAQRGHQVAAVDLLTNDWDGLGASKHYEAKFVCLQAEYDRLPLKAEQCDLVLFNASFHYSEGYSTTLAEALRVLAPGGRIVIIDSPLYHDESSGARMVAERRKQFVSQFGFPSDSLASENFLTYARLRNLEAEFGLKWNLIEPATSQGWKVKRFVNGLRSRREPAKLPIIIGTRTK